jgi:hypothetical protein
MRPLLGAAALPFGDPPLLTQNALIYSQQQSKIIFD